MQSVPPKVAGNLIQVVKILLGSGVAPGQVNFQITAGMLGGCHLRQHFAIHFACQEAVTTSTLLLSLLFCMTKNWVLHTAFLTSGNQPPQNTKQIALDSMIAPGLWKATKRFAIQKSNPLWSSLWNPLWRHLGQGLWPHTSIDPAANLKVVPRNLR